MFRRIIYFCIALALLAAAYFGFSSGFSKLADVRQLDRLPVSPIAALTEGEYLVSGTIVDAGQTIIAPFSNDPVVYFAYKLTETYTDSDGNQQTRTLDSGESSTAFFIQDDSGTLQVQPGFNLSEIRFIAPQTYQRKQGDLTYTEQTMRAGDQLQLTGKYQPSSHTLSLQPKMMVPKFITANRLSQSTGQSLLMISLVLSASAGGIAIGLALLLSSFSVHRFWVFVLTMTIGLMGSLTYIGLHWVNTDWQRADQLYSLRFQGVMQQPTNQAAQVDLYQYYSRIEETAQGWPDRVVFSALFDAPAQQNLLTIEQQQQIQQAALTREFSRLEPAWLGTLLSVVGVILCAVFIWLSLNAIRFKRLVEFIPTSKSKGLSYGLAELSGTVDEQPASKVLTSPLNQKTCYAYHYRIEEKRGSGKNQRWEEIESGSERVPFWLKDDEGRVRIVPENAAIEYPKKRSHQKGSRRYTESWLMPNAKLYCLGFAGIDEHDQGRLCLKDDPNKDVDFLISARTEQQVIQGKGVNGFLFTGFALMLGIMAATLWLTSHSNFNPLDLLTVSLVVPMILLFIVVTMHYNSLVFLKQRVHKTAADIDSLLQKRADLIPRLGSTVSAYLEHESDLMAQITKARSSTTSVEESVAEAESQWIAQKKVQRSLFALVEQYPELKANKVIAQFSQQMSDAEDELALIRQGYNDAVMLYNNQIEKLPDVFLAKLFSFKPEQSFQVVN